MRSWAYSSKVEHLTHNEIAGSASLSRPSGNWAYNSVVECLFDKQDVGGSIPSKPTEKGRDAL